MLILSFPILFGAEPSAEAETGIRDRISLRRPDRVAEAGKLLDEGNRSFNQGNFLAAADCYRRAIDRIPIAPMTIDLRSEALFRLSLCVTSVVHMPESRCPRELKLAWVDFLTTQFDSQRGYLSR